MCTSKASKILHPHSDAITMSIHHTCGCDTCYRRTPSRGTAEALPLSSIVKPPD